MLVWICVALLFALLNSSKWEMSEYLAPNWGILFGSEGLVVPTDIHCGVGSKHNPGGFDAKLLNYTGQRKVMW